jgi:excisionase family DNA binding protein
VPPERSKLTPPEVARLWGVSPDKVLAWIAGGELRAVNAATRPGGRPRWLIDRADLAAFEAARAARPAAPAPSITARVQMMHLCRCFLWDLAACSLRRWW